MKRKLLTETPVCPRERLVIISYTTILSFAKERIGPLAAIITTVFYLLALYLFALPNTPENPFSSIYSEALIKTTCQHILLLVGFDTLIYRKYYDTPLILVGHQWARMARSSTQTRGVSPMGRKVGGRGLGNETPEYLVNGDPWPMNPTGVIVESWRRNKRTQRPARNKSLTWRWQDWLLAWRSRDKIG
jgi:hypothetical protein